MPIVLAALFLFAILTLWIPAYWPVAVFQVGMFALCVVVLWRRPPTRIPYPAIPLAAAVVWGLVQLGASWTVYAFDTRMAVVQWATFLAVFATGFCLFQEPENLRWFRSAMIWFACGVSVWAVIQAFTADGKVFWLFPTSYTRNLMGPILYRNHYAAFIEAALPIALYQAFRGGQGCLLYSAMAAAMYASVIASTSRTGTVLATAEILTVALLMAVRGITTRRAVGAALLRAVILLAAFTAIVGWTRLWDRLREPDPMAMRNDFAMSSLRMIADRPFLGFGLGTWATIYPRYALVDSGTFTTRAHDDWLQFAVEGGVPFGIMIFTLFIWCLRPACRSVWGIGVIAVFLHAFVDYPFSRPALGSWAILIIAMLAAADSASEAGETGFDSD